MFETLYEEFGEENVHIVRRGLTAKNNKVPSYIELLAELYLKQGPETNKRLNSTVEKRGEIEPTVKSTAAHHHVKGN